MNKITNLNSIQKGVKSTHMSPEKAKPRRYDRTIDERFDPKTRDSMQDLLDANKIVVAKTYARELQRHGVSLDNIQVRTPETVQEAFEMEGETWRLRVMREIDQKAREQKPSEQRRQDNIPSTGPRYRSQFEINIDHPFDIKPPTRGEW